MSQNTEADEYTRRAASVGVGSIQLTKPGVGLYDQGAVALRGTQPRRPALLLSLCYASRSHVVGNALRHAGT